MSDDLIKRSDAIGACAYETIECYEARKAIRALPSADRPQGEWMESFKPITVKRGYIWKTKLIHDGWSCSECSEVVEKRYPNCPYCLAKMKGADDE